MFGVMPFGGPFRGTLRRAQGGGLPFDNVTKWWGLGGYYIRHS